MAPAAWSPPPPPHDGDTLLQAEQLRRTFRELAADFFGFVDLGQETAADVEFLQQRLRPDPVPDVQQQRPRGVADLGRILARHAEPDIVLGEQNLRRFVVVLRLVLAQPEDFGGSETGQRRIGYELDQLLASAGLLLDLGALGGGPLVVPENRRADDVLLLVEEDAAVHLAAEADSRHLVRLDFAGFQDLLDAGNCRIPPVGGILLGPPRVRVRHAVRRCGRRQDSSVLTHSQRLGAAGADVNPQKNCHTRSVLRPVAET